MYLSELRRRLLMTLLLLTSSIYVYSQELAYPFYKIISANTISAAQKEKLNKSLSSLHQLNKVVSLIKPHLNNYGSRIVIKAFRDKDNFNYVYLNKSSFRGVDLGSMITESKGAASLSINRLGDFKLVLRDTLAVIDTLRLRVNFQSSDFPKDGYFLVSLNEAGEILNEVKLTVDQNGSIAIHRDLFGQKAESYLQLELHNSKTPLQVLGAFHLYFLAKDLDEIKNFVSSLLQEDPAMNYDQIASIVDSYIRCSFGTLTKAALSNWLNAYLIGFRHD